MRRTFVRGLDLREWDIVGGLLQMISSFGGRRVCDDFDFAKYVPEVEHRREVEQRFHTYNGDPDEYDPTGDYSFEHAWLLAAFYADLVPDATTLKFWEFPLIAALLWHGEENFSWQATPLSDKFATLMGRMADLIDLQDLT